MRRLERLDPKRLIPAFERGDGRGRSQDVDDGVRLEPGRCPIAGEAPWRKHARPNGVSAAIARDHRPVRQVAESRPPERFAPVLDPFAMEHFVHRSHVARSAGESSDKGFRRLPPALEARAVAGGESGRLVEEKELGVISSPNVAMTILEFANADEPVLVLPPAATERLIVAMQPPAAVAHHPSALGDGVQFAERIDAILQRMGSVRQARGRQFAFHERQVHASGGLGVFGGGDMALELRPNCEYCDKDLPPDASEARICS